MVPPPHEELCEQFLGSFESFSGTLSIFRSSQAEHKHHAKHQDVGKRILERLHETIQTGCALSRIL